MYPTAYSCTWGLGFITSVAPKDLQIQDYKGLIPNGPQTIQEGFGYSVSQT